MTNKEAIEELNHILIVHNTSLHQEAIKLAITALEKMDRVKMVTKEEINKWYNNKCKDGYYTKALSQFARDHGILIEPPKVKKWKWTNGEVTTEKYYTEEQFEYWYFAMDNKNIYVARDSNFYEWHKVEGSEVEVDNG